MPRVKEIFRCRAQTPQGPCLAPAGKDGYGQCKHGDESREWTAKYARADQKHPCSA